MIKLRAVCVQVSASLDALTDIFGGKVNIHVLMALAAFASVFMGNPLEGGLLLAMFNLAHIGKNFKLSYSVTTLCVCVCVLKYSNERFKFYHLKCMVIAAEEYFTSRSMVDVKELKENYPDFALVLDITNDNLPNTSDLAYQRVPVHDVEVGSYLFVGAGEVCVSSLISLWSCSIISIR